MWHIIWHVIAGLGLIVSGVSVAFFCIVFSAFGGDSPGAMSGAYVLWAIAAVGAAAAICGIWLVLFL